MSKPPLTREQHIDTLLKNGSFWKPSISEIARTADAPVSTVYDRWKKLQPTLKAKVTA